jgi:hypothetical protein
MQKPPLVEIRMPDKSRLFVEEHANPHSWLLMADNLHEQATGLYQRRSASSILTKLDAKGAITEQMRGIDKSVFLLGGFALENAIKAFLVYENPSWISNGRLCSKLKSHNLTVLQSQSKLIPYRKNYLHVLEAFESGLDSRFRYPCALTVEDTRDEHRLYEHLWQGYCKVMAAYGNKLMLLLNRGWKGPHGFNGRWTIRGDFLGSNDKLPARYRTRAQLALNRATTS